MTYTEESKREELFHEDTRYLIIDSGPSRPVASSDADELEDVRQPISLSGGTTLGQKANVVNSQNRSRRKSNGKGKNKATSKETFDLGGEESLLGYLSFRFDTEETLSDRDVEVIYWYVSQVATLRLFPTPLSSSGPMPSLIHTGACH
jgi:hypothetical protein